MTPLTTFNNIEYIDFAIRLSCALFCGLLVGFERQWINRVAGIQTNVLVSAGACLFILGAYFVEYEGQSVSRIGAQIVSGIGFLGAGMIFRNGFTTHGINTAATVWCSAAIGVLCGMGLIPYALIAALFLIFANTLFRKLDHLISQNRKWIDSRIVKNFEVQVLCDKEKSKDIRAKVISSVNIDDHKIFSVKTNMESKSLAKVKVSFSTHSSNHEGVQKACEDIEKFDPTIIVDWSEIK